jgi:hypothetical protein
MILFELCDETLFDDELDEDILVLDFEVLKIYLKILLDEKVILIQVDENLQDEQVLNLI